MFFLYCQRFVLLIQRFGDGNRARDRSPFLEKAEIFLLRRCLWLQYINASTSDTNSSENISALTSDILDGDDEGISTVISKSAISFTFCFLSEAERCYFVYLRIDNKVDGSDEREPH